MIRSSSIEGHHFLIARRRGYDRDEVDAVMKRLIATLRTYEQREESGDLAEVTMLEAARRARLEHEQETNTIQSVPLETAVEMSEAHEQAERLLADARYEADRIVELARADSAGTSARRSERSEALITAALSEVKALRSRALREINDFQTAKRSEAASLLQTAELTSEDLLEDARHEAGTILGRARREHTELERRLTQLRSAIAAIEGQFRSLAESTIEQTEIMASMIALETDDLEDIVEEREPEVVRLTQPGMTIDLTDGKDDHPPAETGQDGTRFAVAPGSTIYERRGGGIRSRLEKEDYDGNVEGD